MKMNLEKLESHLTAEYNHLDINSISIVPKDVVVFIHNNELKKGIVFRLNLTSITVYDLNFKKFLVKPSSICVITELINHTTEYSTYLDVYTKIKNGQLDHVNNIRYVVLLWQIKNPLPEHKNMDRGIFILPYNVGQTNRANANNWWKCLAEFYKTHNKSAERMDFWILTKYKTYVKLNESNVKNILIIHPNNAGNLIEGNLVNRFMPFVQSSLNPKEKFKLWLHKSWCTWYLHYGCFYDSTGVFFYNNNTYTWMYNILRNVSLNETLTLELLKIFK